jgi:hypothetical protein
VIDRMGELPNCTAWYSCDRDTGVPPNVPTGVRIAWLAASPEEVVPGGIDLVFRVRGLRRAVAPESAPVCPSEDGVPRPRQVTCDACGRCWHPAPEATRTPLRIVDPTEPG